MYKSYNLYMIKRKSLFLIYNYYNTQFIALLFLINFGDKNLSSLSLFLLLEITYSIHSLQHTSRW